MALDFPVIYLLAAHLDSDELAQLEEQIPTLTYDVNEADIILGKIFRKGRALFELRKLRLATEEVTPTELPVASQHERRSSVDSDTASDGGASVVELNSTTTKTIKVVKLAWFTDSIKAGVVLPVGAFVVYEGRKVSTPSMKPPPTPVAKTSNILKHAITDTEAPAAKRPKSSYGPGRRNDEYVHRPAKRPALIHQTTSEHEVYVQLPPIPEYLHTTYSCQRPTPIRPPNEKFIQELIKIRTARTLNGDKVGVRAYSSAIAALAAYPHTLSSAREVSNLPGCGSKIALLFQEFKDTGELKEANDEELDPKLAVMRLFYEIWGVAETTAREFYNKGWRDLDDVVEYGWGSLTRVQQIGLKFYDEFQLRIPRAEVESIANTILEHANRVRKGFQMVIVGGYRRGKLESGDVDVVLSHPDEAATNGFIEDIVVSLERDKFITHTLTISTKNSERGQMPVAWKGNQKKAGTGFDTLDKALVVWQDPKWSSGEVKKNLNPHRRVDIIISPWKTAGCAVLGWTSGTTFQRDLRRYCKKERGLKFDSSGIRSRSDGSWVDLESGADGQPAPDMLTAERRVFAGLGLEWRPPEERCTN
ncbi:hypothetical protein B0H63DRAFT_244660 [Podospora didyma]|uniref:DNA polymerase n=1 Tax=Podospora didyma TaxID=330526 RepID=A0AAE0NBX3_9PEZI|nr:hypothetical protein B0H63DRAFT_244660 [Podospora didyma]